MAEKKFEMMDPWYVIEDESRGCHSCPGLGVRVRPHSEVEGVVIERWFCYHCGNESLVPEVGTMVRLPQGWTWEEAEEWNDVEGRTALDIVELLFVCPDCGQAGRWECPNCGRSLGN